MLEMFVFNLLDAHFILLCMFKKNNDSITGGKFIAFMVGILLIGFGGSCLLGGFLLIFILFGIFFIIGLTLILGFLLASNAILAI